MNVLFNGAAVAPFGSSSGPQYAYALLATASAPSPPVLFPKFIQWKGAGVAAGDAGARIVNFAGAGFTCTRGVGENSNVVTVRIAPAALP